MHVRSPAVLASVILAMAVGVEAQDWELWSDMTTMPPGEMQFPLPIVPSGEGIAIGSAEDENSPTDIGLNKTLEKDGLEYKALQFTRDASYEATVPTGVYLRGLLGQLYPMGTADPVEMFGAMNLVQVEIDGTVIPIDDSYLLRVEEFPFPGFVLGLYNVYPIFHTPGTHTYVETFRPEEPYFLTVPFEGLAAALGVVDPSPEFEGRRVYLPEEVGDPVDGQIVFSYTLTVEDMPTAVANYSWARIKQGVTSE
jgi:hypothetical protein